MPRKSNKKKIYIDKPAPKMGQERMYALNTLLPKVLEAIACFIKTVFRTSRGWRIDSAEEPDK